MSTPQLFHPKPMDVQLIIIAINLGKFNSMACIYDCETQETQFETLATERGFFKTMINSYSPDLVVVEACGPSGWVSDLCGEIQVPTHVPAKPMRNASISSAKPNSKLFVQIPTD